MDFKDIRIRELQERVYKKQEEVKTLNDKLLKTSFVIVDLTAEVEKYRYQSGLRSHYKPEETE
jgi:hypothetical protein